MTDLPLFSTKVRYAVILEKNGLNGYMDSILVFPAANFTDAYQRALELGRKFEKDYTNGDGDRVVWRFSEVISLDRVRQNVLGWMEVYSEPVYGSDMAMSVDTEFHPEQSSPTQTL